MEDGPVGQNGVAVKLISVLMLTLQEIGHVTTHHLRMVVQIVKGMTQTSLGALTTNVQV